MTQFEQSNKKAKETSTPSGKVFFETCQEHLQDTVDQCVAGYDGESVEDFALNLVESIWPVVHQDLVQSFRNGQRSKGNRRRPSARSFN